MGTSALSSETLMLAGLGIGYDTAFKLIFSEKSVLAFILRDCVGGYDGMTPQEIEQCITYGPVAHSIPIAPGLTNAPGSPLYARGDAPTPLRGSRTEDKVPYEGQTAFDFYFEATAPQDGATVGIHVDVEGQAAYTDGTYPMEYRAQYYAARLLSSQYGREFARSHYEDLKRVYSVWLFADGPQELRGSVWSTETSWRAHEASDTAGSAEIARLLPCDLMTIVFGFMGGKRVEGASHANVIDLLNILFEREKTNSAEIARLLPCDLMTIVFGFMGGKRVEGASHANVIDLLNILFEREKTNRSKRDILEREFSIAVTPGLEAGSMALDEINEGMVRMLERRLSEQWLAEGRTDGLEEGRRLGLAEGREAGLAEGREAGLAEGREAGLAEGREAGLEDGRRLALAASVRTLGETLGLSPEAAMDALGVSPAERDALLKTLSDPR